MSSGYPTNVTKSNNRRAATSGHTLSEILSWSDDRLEAVHDYIQWLFPTGLPSGVNPAPPLVSAMLPVPAAQEPAAGGSG